MLIIGVVVNKRAGSGAGARVLPKMRVMSKLFRTLIVESVAF
jgi:hypothetical protein